MTALLVLLLPAAFFAGVVKLAHVAHVIEADRRRDEIVAEAERVIERESLNA